MFDPGRFVHMFPDKKFAKDKKYAMLEGLVYERPKPLIKDMEET